MPCDTAINIYTWIIPLPTPSDLTYFVTIKIKWLKIICIKVILKYNFLIKILVQIFFICSFLEKKLEKLIENNIE